jgi:hypothetical protein
MEAGRKTRGALDPDAAIGLGAARAADGPCCAWPGCAASGSYPAPQSTRELRRFIWFCLEHIREYNKSWNYFAGMNEHQIEAHRRADTTWHRPSWRFGAAGVDETSRFRDPFGFFDNGEAGRKPGDAGAGHNGAGRGGAGHGLGKGGHMMEVLDLEFGFTLEELKRRYKTLVKRHHPDLHGGDRTAEERLKQINEAYAYLVANRLYR